MKTINLKHITPYADKCLKGLFNGIEDILTEIDFENGIVSSMNNGSVLVKDFKPQLHPLQNLTMKMAIDCGYPNTDIFIQNIISRSVSIEIWEDLINNHWDVFCLIPLNLAVQHELST